MQDGGLRFQDWTYNSLSGSLIYVYFFFFKDQSFFFFFKCIYLFIWLHWVFVAARGLFLVAASGGYSSLWCTGLSLR